MCRLFIYLGPHQTLKNIIWLPEKSIMKQSYQETYTPFLNQPNPRDHTINVDGFGIGWYQMSRKNPFLYRSSKSPWSDCNILNISEYINSHLFMAHIRAIKPFSNSIVNENNCHPFQYRNILFMHNGDLKETLSLKKYLYQNVPNYLLNNIQGQTDSELVFCLFLSKLPNEYTNPEKNPNQYHIKYYKTV